MSLIGDPAPALVGEYRAKEEQFPDFTRVSYAQRRLEVLDCQLLVMT